MLLVTPAERFREQRRSLPLAAQVGLNSDGRQVPMRIAWVVGRHLAKHGIHIRHHVARHALVQDGGDRTLVRLHTRRQPQRTPEIAVDAPCRPARKGFARERPDEPPEVGEVSQSRDVRGDVGQRVRRTESGTTPNVRFQPELIVLDRETVG